MKERFTVTGMTCSACSTRVEKVVSKLEGANQVSVNLLTGTMSVDFDEERLTKENIVSVVEKSGYGAEPFDEEKQEGSGQKKENATDRHRLQMEEQEKSMKKRLVFSVVLLIPLMIISMSHMVMGGGHMIHPLTVALAQILFLIPIVALNRKYFIGGLPALWRRSPNMDSLVAVGAGAAIVYGLFSVFYMTWGLESGNMAMVHTYGNDVYFESAAMILTLITVGKYLETRSKGKTSGAIEKLMDLAPKKATVLRDGKETIVAAEELREGDILIVRPGESFAADGRITEGQTVVDESAITGESIPVSKEPGSQVVSATLNKTGFIKVKCEKVGEDTTISQIIRLVDEASASKAPIARLADKVAGIFVPAVMSVALLAAVIWYISGATFAFSLSIGIAVLVISCPCALGLATPVAIMVGTGKGAENGILIKSGQALETLCKVDTVVLDKTGTISEGKPYITDVVCDEKDRDELLHFAFSIEKGSEHPLAEAVVQYCQKENAKESEVSNFAAVFGRGACGLIEGRKVLTGNEAYMRESHVDITQYEDTTFKLAEQGKSLLFFAVDGRALGIMGAADREKPSSVRGIAKFKEMHLDVIMLTGDNRVTAQAMGKRLGITETIGNVMPQDKEREIAKLQETGHTVAMIGDGINDGPALMRADVGMAIGAGTEVAIESADAVLMKNDLEDGVFAIELSKAVIRNIKENLFWAFFYNVICIPLAAGALYPVLGIKLSPMIGAAAMSLSSVCVVLNALRLRRFGKQNKEIDNRGEQKTDNQTENREEKKMMDYTLKIEGMMCKHCQSHVSDALNGMDSVTATVNLEEGTATVKAERPIDEAEFKKAIEDAGYELISVE